MVQILFILILGGQISHKHALNLVFNGKTTGGQNYPICVGNFDHPVFIFFPKP